MRPAPSRCHVHRADNAMRLLGQDHKAYGLTSRSKDCIPARASLSDPKDTTAQYKEKYDEKVDHITLTRWDCHAVSRQAGGGHDVGVLPLPLYRREGRGLFLLVRLHAGQKRNEGVSRLLRLI